MPVVGSRGDEVSAGGKMFHYQDLFVTVVISFFCRPAPQMTQNKKANAVQP